MPMTHADIVTVMQFLRPDGAWTVAGTEIIMADPKDTPPTEAEIAVAASEALLSAERKRLSISLENALIGLVAEGWITEQEGDAWLTGGALPALVGTAIASLPEAERFAAKARLLKGTRFYRATPLMYAIQTSAGATDEEVDTFFRTYSTLG